MTPLERARALDVVPKFGGLCVRIRAMCAEWTLVDEINAALWESYGWARIDKSMTALRSAELIESRQVACGPDGRKRLEWRAR